MNPRWRIYWLVGLVTLLASNISEAAESPPRIQWQKTFGGTNNEWLNVMVPTSDGGFILGGSSDSAASGNKTSTGYGGADFWIVKVDADGTKLWENTFGGLSDDILNSVEQTTDGGLILGGSSSSAVTGNKLAPHWGGVDYWVIKLDFNGQKRWDKSFGGSGDDQLYSVHQLPDGGYLLSGSSEFGVSGNKTNAGFGSLDLWVVKLDVDGNKVWEKSFGGADGE